MRTIECSYDGIPARISSDENLEAARLAVLDLLIPDGDNWAVVSTDSGAVTKDGEFLGYIKDLINMQP